MTTYFGKMKKRVFGEMAEYKNDIKAKLKDDKREQLFLHLFKIYFNQQNQSL